MSDKNIPIEPKEDDLKKTEVTSPKTTEHATSHKPDQLSETGQMKTVFEEVEQDYSEIVQFEDGSWHFLECPPDCQEYHLDVLSVDELTEPVVVQVSSEAEAPLPLLIHVTEESRTEEPKTETPAAQSVAVPLVDTAVKDNGITDEPGVEVDSTKELPQPKAITINDLEELSGVRPDLFEVVVSVEPLEDQVELTTIPKADQVLTEVMPDADLVHNSNKLTEAESPSPPSAALLVGATGPAIIKRLMLDNTDIHGDELVPRHMLEAPPLYYDPILIPDVDGCLLDWMGAFCKYVNDQWEAQGDPRRLDPKKQTAYFFCYDWTSRITPREFGNFFRDFGRQSIGGFGGIPEFEGAIEAIWKIQAAGIVTIPLTDAPGATDFAADGQLYHTGVAQSLRQIQLLSRGVVKDKRDVKFVSGNIKALMIVNQPFHAPAAIEDRLSTAVSIATDYKLHCFLLTQGYNLALRGKCDGVGRYDNLAAALSDILKFYDILEKAGVLKPRKKS